MQWLIDIIIAAVLPKGVIASWYGAKEDVPTGWQICDGTNDTPNLKDKFIRGASDGFPPGHTAGSSSYEFDFTGDGHSHTIVSGTDIAAGGDYAALTSLSVASGKTDESTTAPPLHTLYWIMKM